MRGNAYSLLVNLAPFLPPSAPKLEAGNPSETSFTNYR